MALQQRRRKPSEAEPTTCVGANESDDQEALVNRRPLPIMWMVLGYEVERNAVLAALGAVAATGTILGLQYVFYIVFLAPAPLEEGDLPFIS